MQVITSIDATVTYVSGPNINQVQTPVQTNNQAQTPVQTPVQTATGNSSGPGSDSDSGSGGGPVTHLTPAIDREIIAATNAALQAIENVVVPANSQDAAPSAGGQSVGIFLQVQSAAKSNNGGTLAGVPSSVIDSAILQTLQSLGMAATPNGNPDDGDPFAPTGNPLYDGVLLFDSDLVEFFQTNDVTSGS
jgi:hypothetical protein